MSNLKIVTRSQLENRFEAGDIPEALHFQELIYSSLNQADDGIKKGRLTALSLFNETETMTADAGNNRLIQGHDLIEFFGNSFEDHQKKWKMTLVTAPTNGIAITNIKEEDPQFKGLFIGQDGKVGIGQQQPTRDLDVNGTIKADQIQGFLQPLNGAGTNRGIQFTDEGGTLKEAFLKYHTGLLHPTLEIKAGIGISGKSNIVLMPTGNVGIGQENPEHKLSVEGAIKLTGDLELNGSQKIVFKTMQPEDQELKLIFWPGYGIGIEGNALINQSERFHHWYGNNLSQRAMELDGHPSGGLKVLTSGQSVFQGALSVGGSTPNMPANLRLNVIGDAKADHFIGQMNPSEGHSAASGILFERAAGTNKQGLITFGKLNRNGVATALKMNIQNGTSADHFIFDHSGAVGIGVPSPGAKLDVGGNIKLNGSIQLPGSESINFGSDATDNIQKIKFSTGQFIGSQGKNMMFHTDESFQWKKSGNAGGMKLDARTSGALEVLGTGNSKIAGKLLIGNTTGRNSGSHLLDIKGTAIASEFHGNMVVNHSSNRSDRTSGIRFTPNPGKGSHDRAWIKYYARDGENTTFEIGTADNIGDHIALMPSLGNVGIGTINPSDKLEVNGRLKATTLNIGGVIIGPRELRILKDLADSKLEVKIMSNAGYVLDNYKDSVDNGILWRTIQFQRDRGYIQTKMKLVLWNK